MTLHEARNMRPGSVFTYRDRHRESDLTWIVLRNPSVRNELVVYPCLCIMPDGTYKKSYTDVVCYSKKYAQNYILLAEGLP